MVGTQTEKARWPSCVRVSWRMAARDVVERRHRRPESPSLKVMSIMSSRRYWGQRRCRMEYITPELAQPSYVIKAWTRDLVGACRTLGMQRARSKNNIQRRQNKRHNALNVIAADVLSYHTYAYFSIAGVSTWTESITPIAAHRVSTRVSSTTTTVVRCTLVDIYIITSNIALFRSETEPMTLLILFLLLFLLGRPLQRGVLRTLFQNGSRWNLREIVFT